MFPQSVYHTQHKGCVHVFLFIVGVIGQDFAHNERKRVVGMFDRQTTKKPTTSHRLVVGVQFNMTMAFETNRKAEPL